MITTAAGQRARLRLAPAAMCAGLVVLMIGTFLPWLESGRVSRNSYAGDSALRELVESSLRKHGYKVLAAGSGEQAERLARDFGGPIHLLLTDVVMPRTGGKEFADRITTIKPGVRVLWMSGYTDDAIVHHGVLEPGIHFLQKPFTPITLAQKVREVLDKN